MARFLNISLVFGVLVGSFVPLVQAAYFSDVKIDHPSYVAIQHVREQEYMNGYEDGTFRPSAVLNRAELLKVAIAAGVLEDEETDGAGENSEVEESVEIEENCFEDVPTDAWYAESICTAKEMGIVSGYEDGTFRPGDDVSVVEAAKIVALTQGLEMQGEGEYWYTPYLNVLDGKSALSASFLYVNQGVTRGELAEMVWRLSLDEEEDADVVDELDVADVTAMAGSTCMAFSGEDIPGNIDIQRVRETWLGWNNEVRDLAGLHAYEYNDQLGRTAAIWSDYSKDRGNITHSRPGQTVYYDYWLMTSWFKDLGLTFKVVGGSGFVENIGWDYYSCNEEDCTDELITAIRGTFNFFMGEKGHAYAPHYDSIMSSSYQMLGVGVAIDEARKKYYLTIHYGTEITSNPDPVCP